MPSDSISPPIRYHLFILSLWQESGSLSGQPAGWHFSLEYPRGEKRLEFKNLHELIEFLGKGKHIWTDAPENMK